MWPIWTALLVAVVGALAIEWLRSRGRTTSDLALALWFYGGIAAGVVLGAVIGRHHYVIDVLLGVVVGSITTGIAFASF